MKPDSIAPRALVIEDNPDVVEARDFVPKPFPTTGHTLQEAIRLALRR